MTFYNCEFVIFIHLKLCSLVVKRVIFESQCAKLCREPWHGMAFQRFHLRNLNRLFMESVSHLALKLLSLMGERGLVSIRVVG